MESKPSVEEINTLVEESVIMKPTGVVIIHKYKPVTMKDIENMFKQPLSPEPHDYRMSAGNSSTESEEYKDEEISDENGVDMIEETVCQPPVQSENTNATKKEKKKCDKKCVVI